MAVPMLRFLGDDPAVESVLISDLNAERASALAAQLGGKFTSAGCDANDPARVESLMSGHDVAVCYIGPFYFFERKLAACAIRAGIPYVSIADDFDAYLDVMKLDGEASAAGVKILTGFGNSPGLTQILARKGYNEVPNPFRISVNWCGGSDEAVGPSNLTHVFHIFNGAAPQWIEGRRVMLKAGGGRKLVEFPAPVGKCPVYHTGHAESVTLPENLAGLREVTVHGGTSPAYIVTLIKMMSALGLFRSHSRRVSMASFFHRIEGWFASAGQDKSVGRVEVYGADGGAEVCRCFTYVGHIADITSAPAYLAAKWLCEGRFDAKPGGVYAPERILDAPDEFIEDLKKLGVQIAELPVA